MWESAGPRRWRAIALDLAAATAALVLATAVYFVTPVYRDRVGWAWGFAAEFVIGLVAVSALVIHAVRRYRRGVARNRAALVGLAVSLYLAVLLFAAVYFGLRSHLPTEIAGLRTKLDALYFSLSITTTVGFGDIHAQGQIGRALVCVQLAFNVGFLGVAITTLRSSPSTRTPPHRENPTDPGSPEI